MKVQVEDLSPIERKLSIEVEAARIAQELDRAYHELARHVKVAGFRPGKVPRRILEQRFKEQVEDDVVHRVVERAFLDAIREHSIDAVSNPQITNKGFRADQPFAFEARVEVKPKVTPKEYQALPLKRGSVEVKDADVDSRIEEIRQRMARLEPLAGREVAQKGDFATVDFEAVAGGQPFPGSKGENVTVEVAAGEVVEGKVEGLVGLKVGESREVAYAFPKEYGVKEVQGKTAQFTFRLKGLKSQVTPELGDDFAREIGGGETLADLKAKVRQDLERSVRAKAEQDEREKLIELLIERNPFEVPKAMVEHATNVMLSGALRVMSQQGVDLRKLNLDLEKLRADFGPRAQKEVKGALLLEAIAAAENLSPTDPEVDGRMEELAKAEGVPVSKVKKRFRDPAERANLVSRIREEKAVAFLKSKASYS